MDKNKIEKIVVYNDADNNEGEKTLRLEKIFGKDKILNMDAMKYIEMLIDRK